MDTLATTSIKFKDTIQSDIKNKIIGTFDDIYGNCNYIKKYDDINYTGDMGCLCVLGTRVLTILNKNNLLDSLSQYDICSNNTDYKENLLDEE